MIKFPIVAIIGAVDRFTAPLTKMQARVNKIFGPLSELGSKLNLLKETSGIVKVGEAFAGVGSSIGRVMRTFGFFAAAVGGLAASIAGALYGIAVGTARSGNEAAKAARKIGISVEAYQELAYAAQLADVEQATLSKSLQIMVRTMGQAALGSKKANEGFRRLGINVKGADGKLRPAEQIFGEVADRLNELNDPLKRVAIQSMIFGRGAAELTNLLLEGSDGLERYAAEARRLGVVMSGPTTAAGEDFMDSIERVHAALAGVRNVIGATLLPVLQHLSEKLVEFLVGHRTEIAQWAEKFAAGLPEKIEWLRQKFTELFKDMQPVFDFAKKLIDRFGIFKVTVAALGGALALVLIPAVLSTVAALVTLSTALVSTPAGWVILVLTLIAAEIAGLIAVIVLWWDTWKEAWDSIVGLAKFALDVIEYKLSKFADALMAPFKIAFDWIEKKLAGIADIVPDWLKGSLGIKVAAGPSGAPAAPGLAGAVAASAAGAPGRAQASVKVEFANAPKGLRVSETANDGADLDLQLGYSMLGGY